MTSELDAKGPHVHSDEHNPERDIPRAHTAPQLGNEPSGIAAWLIRQAQQFEDQHAPQHLTIGLREAAGEIKRLRAALEWINQQRYTGRNTINPDNAFEHAILLNEKLIAVMDIARAALAEEKKG
jgi:hypothetical protein